MSVWLIANMAPLMFAVLVVFLLVGYPVAFSLAANGLLFGFVGIELGLLTPALFQALPWGVARRLAHAMAWGTWALDKGSRKREAVENLLRAFPQMRANEARRTVRRVYYHLADTVLDWLKLARLVGRGGGKDLFEFVGFEKVQEAARGKGIVFVTGHFGHWEALGIATPLAGYRIWTVGRSFDNELLDRYINRLRSVTGQQIVSSHGATRQVFRVLAEGTNVGVLIDQDARRHGIFVDYFGRPASTTDVAARLCLRTGSPAVFFYAERIPGQNRFRVVCTDVIEPLPGEERQAEVRRITQRLTSDLEEVVRRTPEQWLWLHRRWKTWPGKYDGPRRRPASARSSAQ